ncbi:RWD domain-containing protein [Aphelenchoides besseyi]|nr:RWD domain-containing protein [Aphelenchoides besseyi]
MFQNERSAKINEEIDSIRLAFSDLIYELTDSRVHAKFSLDVEVIFTIPDGYPTVSPLQHKIHVPVFLSNVQRKIEDRLNQNYELLIGLPLLAVCISDVETIVRDTANDLKEFKKQTNASPRDQNNPKTVAKKIDKPKIFNWKSGPSIEDRKSVFQAHIVKVKTKEEAVAALGELQENTKIARATHNIYAYVVLKSNVVISDCEDDGEHHAGAKLLQLIRRMKCENLLVVVTRWYGGIHLSNDRFRHILNVARELIIEERSNETSGPKQ